MNICSSIKLIIDFIERTEKNTPKKYDIYSICYIILWLLFSPFCLHICVHYCWSREIRDCSTISCTYTYMYDVCWHIGNGSDQFTKWVPYFAESFLLWIVSVDFGGSVQLCWVNVWILVSFTPFVNQSIYVFL